MTIFVDPYHTPIGAIHDMRKEVRLLEESVVRDPLQGTNLGVRAENGITPVFITGCRDSEKMIPLFTHPISVKNLSGKSYLFTDMRLYIKAGADLYNIDQFKRRAEEFEFNKNRGIASLAWAAGDRGRFEMGMRFAGLVFSSLIGQTIGRTETLDFVEQIKVQIVALAYYFTLFHEGPVDYKENEGLRMAVAQYASQNMRMPMTEVTNLLKTFEPMGTFADMCSQITKTIQSSLLKELNVRVMLNLLSTSWYSTNSQQLIAVAMEHPPTWCSILHYVMSYNNNMRSTIGQTVQAQGRGGKGADFGEAYKAMIAEYTAPQTGLRSVMEYLKPTGYASDLMEPTTTE